MCVITIRSYSEKICWTFQYQMVKKTVFFNFVLMPFLFAYFSCKKKQNKNFEEKIRIDVDNPMNDVSAWLVDEDGDSMEDDLNELVQEAVDEDFGHEIADHNTGEGII